MLILLFQFLHLCIANVNIVAITPTYTDTFNTTTNQVTTERYDELTITCMAGSTATLNGIGGDGSQYNVDVVCPALSYVYQLTRETYVPNATNVVVNEVCQKSVAPNVYQSSGQNTAQVKSKPLSTQTFKRKRLYRRIIENLPSPESPYYQNVIKFMRSDGANCSPGLNVDPADCRPYVSKISSLRVADIYYRYPNGTQCNDVSNPNCQAYSTPDSSDDTYVFVNTNTACNPLTDGATCVLVGIAAKFNSSFTAPNISTVANGQCIKFGTSDVCPLVNGQCPTASCFTVPAPIPVTQTSQTALSFSVPTECTASAAILTAAGAAGVAGGLAGLAFSWVPSAGTISAAVLAQGTLLTASGVEQGFCYNKLIQNINQVAATTNKNIDNVLVKLDQYVTATNNMLQNVNTFVQIVNQKFSVQDAQNANFQAQLNTQGAYLAQSLQFMLNQNKINQGVQGQISAIDLFEQQISGSVNTLNATLNNFIQTTNDNFATSRAFEQVLQGELVAVNLAVQKDVEQIERQLTRIQIINGIRFAQFVQQTQKTIDLIQQHLQQLYSNFNVNYQLINGVYKNVQQTYSYLFDISALIQQYHNTLNQIEEEGYWTPFLLSEGSPLANETEWNIISTRTITVNTLIGCQGDQTQSTDPIEQSVIDTFYSSYPLSVVQLNSGSVDQINGNTCFQYNNNQAACLSASRRCSYVTCRFAPANSAKCIPTYGNLSLYNSPYNAIANTNDQQTYMQINGTALFGLSTCTFNPNATNGNPLTVSIAQPNPFNAKFFGCFTPQSTTSISSLGNIIAQSDLNGPFNATNCISQCYTAQNRFASVTTDSNGINYCLCSSDMPGDTQIDVVTQCASNCTAPDSTGRTCGGLETLSVYRTGREDFNPQQICSFYSVQEDCLTDSKCGWILVRNNQGYCSEQSDPVYTTYCNQGQGLVTCYPSIPGFAFGAYNYQSLSQTRYQLASLSQYPLTNDTLLNQNSKTYQDLNHGFYSCPTGLYDIPGNNTHCCATPIVIATGYCLSAIRNPQNPYDLWFNRIQQNCPWNYVPPQLNLTVMIGCSRNASRTQPGYYACVPVVDENTLQQLGYQNIQSWNGSIYLNGNVTRIRQMVSLPNQMTQNGNELYTLFGQGNPMPDLPATTMFYDSYDPSMTLYNYSFSRFYGYNLTSSTVDGGGVPFDLSVWDRHVSVNELLSDVLATDISTYTTVMQTFYGQNPITWGSSFGMPVLQSQSPPSYVDNIRTTKCNYATFGVYQPNLIPVWKVQDLSAVNYGYACGGFIQVNGVSVKQDSCFITDIANINRPATGERLIFGTDPSDTFVYSPPNDVIRPDQGEAGRRGSVTYVHSYGSPTFNLNAFLNANQNFDPQYMMTSIANYAAYIDNSTDQFCGNTSHQVGYGVEQGGLCLLSKQYQIGIVNPTNETLPSGAQPDGSSLIMRLYSSFAPMQFTVKVPFSQVGISQTLDGCPNLPVIQCDPSTQLSCVFTYKNPYQYTLQTNFSVVYHNTQNIVDITFCVAPTILSAASYRSAVFPFNTCQGNLTVLVTSMPSNNLCFTQQITAQSVQNFFGNDSATQIKTYTQTLSTLQLQFTQLTNSITANNYNNLGAYIQSTARVSSALDSQLPYITPFYTAGVLTTTDGLTISMRNISQTLASTSYIVGQVANITNLNSTIQLLTNTLPTLNQSIVSYQSALTNSLINLQFSLNSLNNQSQQIQSYSQNYSNYLSQSAAQIAIDAIAVNYTAANLRTAIEEYLASSGSVPESALPKWLLPVIIVFGVFIALGTILVVVLYYLRDRDIKRFIPNDDEDEERSIEDERKPLVKTSVMDLSHTIKRPTIWNSEIPSLIID